MSAQNSVFMIGWEYPPHNSGGLGVACEGLTHALSDHDTKIFFTLPYAHPSPLGHMEVVECFNPSWQNAGQEPPFLAYSSVLPVSTPATLPIDVDTLHALPQSQLELRVKEYSELVQAEAKKRRQDFDVIHAHDWMSLPAAAQIKQATGKPLVAHIHSIELDRIPSGNGSPFIIQTEWQGLQIADRVIAVSNYTKRLLVERYGVDPSKIDVVHNGVMPLAPNPAQKQFAANRPVVVFMGRLTEQKGAQYFLKVAQGVLKRMPSALFIVAGNGDQYQQLLFSAAYDRLSASVLFSGFLRDAEREQLLNRADVFMMPSLSEPFGLVALEAAQRRTPVIVSKTSGVAEVLPSSIAIDFWDVDRMTATVIELLDNKGYRQEVVTNQLRDISQVTWGKAASEVQNVYRRVFAGI